MTSTPFLVIGAMKSGTTSLEAALLDHPDVGLAAPKETTLFSGGPLQADAVRGFSQPGVLAAGEVSTGYMQRPDVPSSPEQAREHLGDEARVIAVLRHPVARAESHWRHWEQLGRNDVGLAQAVVDPDGPYIAYSRYWMQLQPWLDAFGHARLLPLRMEDLIDSPAATIEQVESFLGVPLTGREAIPRLNTADDRVVARGLGSTVRMSAPYRLLKPLVPASLRRRGALLLGGQRGGAETAPPTDEVRRRCAEILAPDMAALRATWPHLTWNEIDKESTA
ncbi:sulfotransferase family protein [Kytococcus sedentarius]|uniref:sulfotransferase family protein n=1 Tax=Kytococcus sedentarius TaxID=1276 RepID=UPI0038799F2C